MRTAGQSKEAVDLARYLLKPQGRNWAGAVKLLKALEGIEAEALRIVLVRYLAQVLLGAKSEGEAVRILKLMEPFRAPYMSTDGLAPLLYSIGLALDLDR
jgi:hypothetical protein